MPTSATVAVLEAAHATAPGRQGLGRFNRGFSVLSAQMTLRHLGRVEAADLIMQGVATSAAALEVTFDLGCEISDCSGGEQRM
ncbi:MAG: isocitrate/isopropylmalate family dehydrogenase, partial [Gammaproteobacteria bacterium]|nr:isocitrate/isopropylmalate family dehydrogenase [Gammaproteobacteria bacterium]